MPHFVLLIEIGICCFFHSENHRLVRELRIQKGMVYNSSLEIITLISFNYFYLAFGFLSEAVFDLLNI